MKELKNLSVDQLNSLIKLAKFEKIEKQEKAKKAEAKQKKQLANLQERVYKFVKAELLEMNIDTENCVTFNFRVDLGGNKFKHVTEPKKKIRKAYLKKESKKDIELQGKDTAKMKGAKAKDLRGKREFAK